MDSDTKITLMLEELKNICRNIDDKFEKVDERFDKLENRFDNLEKRFDKFEEKNEAEHNTMYNMINSAFLRFEADQTEKFKKTLYFDS